ncbi:MAG TPA: MOSC domain-containing protein [Gammaproteobacteria bacterium]|nr:MOSC domain-containing protein [Gammaproteobacteria bacterium]
MKYVTQEQINARMPWVLQSPRQQGKVALLVVRPSTGQRMTPEKTRFTPETGVAGDNWSSQAYKPADTEVQVAIMNARMIELIAGAPQHWPLAGDQLFVDFNLSRTHLSHGQRLQVGEAELEITTEPHRGCEKFRRRFGDTALRHVNSPLGDLHRLRGVYAKIITAGEVRLGDPIYKR